jgi:hypothetical protein
MTREQELAIIKAARENVRADRATVAAIRLSRSVPQTDHEGWLTASVAEYTARARGLAAILRMIELFREIEGEKEDKP